MESPQDWQVFQRHARDSGPVRIAGASDADVRVSVAGITQTLAVDPETHRFEATVMVPAGGWHRLEAASGAETATVEHVGVGEVFLVAGQSNAGNYGSGKLSSQTGRVASWDGSIWRLSADPQPGAGGNGGSFLPAFGDALVRRFDVPVGVVPLAAGGTSVREWLPKGIRFAQNTTTGHGVKAVEGGFEADGVLFHRLTGPMKALGAGGFRAVLWHQGESDAGQARSGYPADRQISGSQYSDFMEQLIRRSRQAAGWPAPWFTAQTTYHSENDPSDAEFRGAMESLWHKGLAWPGPDTDSLRAEYRDGIHMNGRGLRRHGELWAEKVSPWLDSMTAPPREGPPSSDYSLVWQDEFNGPALDESKWSHRSVGQRRSGWIDPECVTFDGEGHLIMTVRKVGDRFHGAMIGSEHKGMWTYGYFECRAKVATEPGMNTAFWMQAPRMAAPDNGKGIPDDTAHNGTEIDILEYIARQGEVAHFNLHWNGYKALHRSSPADGWLPGLRDGFHVYGVEWTGRGYDFFIDGRHFWHTEQAISKTDQYLILDLEVSDWAGGIATARLPATAAFDWVRVWQKKK